MQLPNTLIHWILAASSAAAVIFFAAGLSNYFDTPRVRPAWVKIIHETTRWLSLLYLAMVVFTPPRSDARAMAGIVMYTVAIAIFLSSIEAARRTRLQRSFIDEPLPDRLIVDGPFRWVRHPFYLGYTLGALAGPIACGGPTLWALAAAMIGLTVAAAFREERAWLASSKAAAYRQYRRRTGMFLPFIGRG